MSGSLLIQSFQKGFHLKIEGNSFKAAKNKRSCCNSRTTLREIQEETSAVSLYIQRLLNGTCFEKDPMMLGVYTAILNKQKSVHSRVTGFRSLFVSKAQKKELRLLDNELKRFKALFSHQALIEAAVERVFSFRGTTDNILHDLLKSEFPPFFKSNPKAKDFTNTPFFISKNRNGYTISLPPLNPLARPEKIAIKSLDELPAAFQRYKARKIKEEFSSYF